MIPPIAGDTTMSMLFLISAGNFPDQAPPASRARAPVHQHPRALQVARGMEPGGEDEMPLQQRARGPEFGQHLVVRHAAS
jgi:hypothetical protein